MAMDDALNHAVLHRPPAPRRGRLLVLGNGPSLKGVDFARFRGVATLGMNAAYRYWDRIDFRPTHYACLDDALIDTHHAEIRRLMAEGRIETAFVTARYLDHHPEAAADPRFHFLDSFVAYWLEVRGAAKGLAFVDSPWFRSEDASKLTTGAYAVRYGAHLGYDDIALIGVDLAYEPMAGAVEEDGLRLRLEETPAENPNYFFDDYQQAGDVFHVANPEEHDRDLHAQSFRVLRNDLVRGGLPLRVVNTAPASQLSATGIFPLAALSDFLGETPLSAVAVPVTAFEKSQAIDNIWLWSQPAFFPFLGGAPKDPPALVFIFNNDEAAAMQADLVAALEATPALRACFGEIIFENLRLSGDADRYERDDSKRAGAEGRRAGPNNMFFGGLDRVAHLSGYALWMETDCAPIRAGWLGRANELLAGGERAWVIGSLYRGGDPLGPREKRHINGNALYAAGDPGFRAFVDEFWKPQLARLVKSRPELAFDCVLETLFDSADSMRPDNAAWRMMQDVAHRFRYADYVQNIVDGAPSEAAKADQLDRILKHSPDTFLVHSRRVAKAASRMRAEAVAPEPHHLVALMRGEAAPQVVAPAFADVTAIAAAAPPPQPPPPRRATLLAFAQWSARLLGRKIKLVALAGALGLSAIALAFALAPAFAPALIALGALLGLAAIAALAFAYFSTLIADEARLAEERHREIKSLIETEIPAIEARLGARIETLERRQRTAEAARRR